MRFLVIAAAAACAACGGSAEEWSWPDDVDALVRERLELARSDREQGHPGALLELAKTFEANGLPAEAARAYEQCLAAGGAELGRGPYEIHYRLGCSLEAAGRSAEALRSFEEARKGASEYAPAHWRAGNLLLELGRDQEARAAFERALELEPTGIAQQLGLARAQLQAGDPSGARATLTPLVARSPRERFAHGLLARALTALGDESGARAELEAEKHAFEQAWTDPWTADVRKHATGTAYALARANELLLAGDAKGAREVLEPVHARVSDNLALTQLLIKARIEVGALPKASELIASAKEQHPGQFKLEYFEGLVALRKKELEPAKKALEASLALNPSCGPTNGALGEVHLRLGALPAAEAAFEKAIEQGETDLRTRTLHAQVEIQLGKLERACELLEAMRREFPGSVVPLAHLAEAQARRGNTEGARATLAEAERIDASFAHLAKVRALLDGAAGESR